MSYRKLNTELKLTYIGSSNIDLSSVSTNSDSTKSSDSYLKPTTNRVEQHYYLDVVESTKKQDKSTVDCQKDVPGELHKPVTMIDQPQNYKKNVIERNILANFITYLYI